jgi:hypothetical protein
LCYDKADEKQGQPFIRIGSYMKYSPQGASEGEGASKRVYSPRHFCARFFIFLRHEYRIKISKLLSEIEGADHGIKHQAHKKAGN